LPVTVDSEDGFDAAIAAVANRVDLVDGENPAFDGGVTFAATGSEQDALAEYLLSEFGIDAGDPTVDLVDTTPRLDARIQNLDFRADAVFDDLAPVASTSAVLGEDDVVYAREVTFASSADGLGVSGTGGGLAVVGEAVSALLFGVETISFDDATWTTSTDATDIDLGQMYFTAFGRYADVAGASFWTEVVEEDLIDADEVADFFVVSEEFTATFGDLTDEAFVDTLVTNANAMDLFTAQQINTFVDALETGAETRGDVLYEIATSDAVETATADLLTVGILLNQDLNYFV